MPPASPKSRPVKPSAARVRALKSGASRIKARKTPAKRNNLPAVADAALVAEFAACLGSSPRLRTGLAPRKRRSLQSALADAQLLSPLSVMPGVRMAATSCSSSGASAYAASAPCLRPHGRRRRMTRLRTAGAWCMAVLVSTAIIAAAAAGLLVAGGQPQPLIDMASADR